MVEPLPQPQLSESYVAWSAIFFAATITFATQVILGTFLFAIFVFLSGFESPLCLVVASAVAFFIGGRLGGSVSAGRRIHACFHAMLTWTIATSAMLLLATSGSPGPLRTVVSGPWGISTEPRAAFLFLAICAFSACLGAWPRSPRR